MHTFSNHFKPAEKSESRNGVKGRCCDFENGIIHAKLQGFDYGSEEASPEVLEFERKVFQDFRD